MNKVDENVNNVEKVLSALKKIQKDPKEGITSDSSDIDKMKKRFEAKTIPYNVISLNLTMMENTHELCITVCDSQGKNCVTYCEPIKAD